jgi:Hypoxanthine-guanine phosphoribosyltransferase
MKKAFSAKDIDRRVAELGEQLRKDAGDNEIFLLGVLRGTTCFVADLLRATSGSVSYGFINVVRDINDTDVATAMEIDFLNWIDIAGKHVYLLKDVVSTGVIETYLMTQLRQKGPAALKLIALLDRPSMRTVDLIADYHAFTVDDGAFVGYGLELDGAHANLPYIARL